MAVPASTSHGSSATNSEVRGGLFQARSCRDKRGGSVGTGRAHVGCTAQRQGHRLEAHRSPQGRAPRARMGRVPVPQLSLGHLDLFSVAILLLRSPSYQRRKQPLSTCHRFSSNASTEAPGEFVKTTW